MPNIPKILIVDDDPRMCESLIALLSNQGYGLKTCNSGQEAIEYLNKNAFDLVLLDIVMPGMDGYQIMDYINKQSPDTLVIVITGNASMESVITALRKGAYDYIRKPFEPEELLITVKNSLDHKRLKSENEVINILLKWSEKRYRYLVQNSPDIIYMLDGQGKFTFISNAVERLLGFKTEQLIGKQYTTIFHDDDLAKASRAFHERRTGDRAASQIELRLKVCSDSGRFKNGKVEYLTFELKSSGIYDKPITEKDKKFLGTYGVIRDISDKKRLESQLQQAHKLEAIGVLSGGIAHDFNNILSVILGNIELAKDDIKPEYGISEFLAEAEKASIQAQALTKQLITFSKGGAPVKKIGSIGDLVTETTNLTISKSNVRCDFFISHDLRLIEFDEGQMKHAIGNVIYNAVESMPDGGTIDVRTENINMTAKQALPFPEGKYIKISIRDHGVGISEEHLPQIFDPYFSTKERGLEKGMGLGLTTTYSIINRHDGHITVESEVGVGTTSSNYLPALEKDIRELDTEKILEPEKPEIRTARILVMDDEKSIRKLSSERLSRLGYESELAKDGAEAIELYKKSMDSGQPFDAVILDLTIKGGMGGKTAIKALLKIAPQIKAIVSSGYSNDPVMTNFRAYGFTGALPKPNTNKELIEALKKIIKE